VIVVVTTGASCLGELLKVNNSLQVLGMICNDIGDEGISSVAEGLKHNKTLTLLYITKCGLSVEGTVVYKTRVQNNLVSSCPVLVYLIKQDHFDQTDDNILFY